MFFLPSKKYNLTIVEKTKHTATTHPSKSYIFTFISICYENSIASNRL